MLQNICTTLVLQLTTIDFVSAIVATILDAITKFCFIYTSAISTIEFVFATFFI